MAEHTLDEIDRKLLMQLQLDSTQSLTELGQKVSLSRNALWRRLTKLEQDGYIDRRVAILNKDKLNLGLSVFITISTDTHSLEWFDEFQRAVSAIPEITGIFRMTGNVDYILHAVIPDMRAYDNLYKSLISRVSLSDVSSSFVMEEIKNTTTLPLSYT
ncbi:Lrp/AsnC family transcriptional regulator [Polycladidibacter hongkongensis]|uniref:Lrp/AsnC family transcriptional regulator n=1 Tax=Polycladidibacter hongkongensis TaxID=1647556 RepID=UPI00082A1D12|nr:Lrp/AsnC family transcriptional regulator [Pseudovibrio hongkongensis]